MQNGQEQMSCNREAYFDTLVRQVDEDTYQVSLQGRKMVGKYFDLKMQTQQEEGDEQRAGYKGKILSLQSDEIDPDTLQRAVNYAPVNDFDGFTFW